MQNEIYPPQFIDRRQYIHITGQKLSHWNQSQRVQFVTFRLADSLPQSKLQEFIEYKQQWFSSHPKPWDNATQEDYELTIIGTIDHWVDAGYGSCILTDSKARQILADTLMHFDGIRYSLFAYVIMPNHVHVLLSPLGDHLVQDIVGSWKRYSAVSINRLLQRKGSLWERETFDRMVRSPQDFRSKLAYIADNPRHLPSSSFTLFVR